MGRKRGNAAPFSFRTHFRFDSGVRQLGWRISSDLFTSIFSIGYKDTTMKNNTPNAAHVWKQMEDSLVPRLHLSVLDRSVYSYLLRHSRLEGKSRLRFSILWLARGIRLTGGPTREAVRRLIAVGALRLIERSRTGHLIEVLLPEEIRAARPRRNRSRYSACLPPNSPIGRRQPKLNLEGIDFLQSSALRQTIHTRERGRCFYCLRRLTQAEKCLDHVVARARSGTNSYRNLVSSCVQCNAQKCERPAGDLLRWLYRERTLTAAELKARLRALNALAAGKLPPPMTYACKRALQSYIQGQRDNGGYSPYPGQQPPANPFPRKGRPPGSHRVRGAAPRLSTMCRPEKAWRGNAQAGAAESRTPKAQRVGANCRVVVRNRGG
jgi:5-methylcytosine-specific restriction endonuclease McrA